MTKIYLINIHDSKLPINQDYIDNNKNKVKKEAKKLGTVYSLKSFQEAFNNDDFYQDNTFILID